MKILIAHSFYRLAGGEDRYVSDQVELLSGHHAVQLLKRSNTALGNGPLTFARMTWWPATTAEAVRCIRRMQPDIIHLHNAYPGFGPAIHLAAERCGVPLIMTVHNVRLRCPNGLSFTRGAPCHRCERGMYVHALVNGCLPTVQQSTAYATSLWAHRFVLRLESKVAKFIAPSEFMSRQLRHWGIAPDRIAIIPNFVAVSGEASTRPGSYGLYVGRLSTEKGLPTLLRALHQAGDPPFRIVGDGPSHAMLQAQAGRHGLRRTTFLGRLPRAEVATQLRHARFVVVPSEWEENAPLAALEAMAEGRPLIVTSMGGLPELVRHGAGLQYEAGDSFGLASHMQAMFADDALARRSGAEALERARARYGPETHRHQLQDLYKHLLPGVPQHA
jgi:glycosyltransferase involved in cell wall biosynthesis